MIALNRIVVPAFLALLLLSATPFLRAQGPPFQTDDPVPVDLHNYEFYVFGAVAAAPDAVDTAGPAFEFNWGAIPNIQLHVVLPFGLDIPKNPTGPNDPSHFGLTDMEFGVKVAIIKQGKLYPQIGIFPMIEAPTGSADKGLGAGQTWYKLPLWLYKDIGPWTLDGGAGYQFTPHDDSASFTYGGFLLKRKLNERFDAVAEVFAHGGSSSTLIDVGSYWHIKSPGWQILFSYGHSIAGETEHYGYLGLYKTWGKSPTDSAPDHPMLIRALSRPR